MCRYKFTRLLLLWALLCLLLSSCVVYNTNQPIEWSYGTLSLSPAGDRATQTYLRFIQAPPSTLKEMTAYLGTAPAAQCHANGKTYSMWRYREYRKGGGFWVSEVFCSSVNGHLVEYFVAIPHLLNATTVSRNLLICGNSPYPPKAPSDMYINYRKLFLQCFVAEDKMRAAHFGKTAVFSPDNESSYFLAPGERVVAWDGGKPIVIKGGAVSLPSVDEIHPASRPSQRKKSTPEVNKGSASSADEADFLMPGSGS